MSDGPAPGWKRASLKGTVGPACDCGSMTLDYRRGRTGGLVTRCPTCRALEIIHPEVLTRMAAAHG